MKLKPTPPSDFDILKFLMDCALKEAALFWQRNTVMLTVNTASLGLCVSYFANHPIDLGTKWLIGFLGIFFSVIWFFLTKIGRQMNHNYVNAAKIVANRMGNQNIISALEKMPSNTILSATGLMFVMAIGFGIAWVLLAILLK
jgi:hypothetical protein